MAALPQTMYCDSSLIQACAEIEGGYDRKMSYVIDKMHADPYFISGPLRSVHGVTGYLAECRLWDMFDWLSERGWDVSYVDSMLNGGICEVYPSGRGKCVKISGVEENEIECDCIIRIDGTLAVGEAKSGGNSFERRDARKRVKAMNHGFSVDSGFILGVPSDHSMSRGCRKENFEKIGGNVIFFPESYGDIAKSAKIAGESINIYF